MKAPLTKTLVSQFSLRCKPTWVGVDGKEVLKLATLPPDAPDHAPYFVFDTNRDAPRGLGVKVSEHGNSYVIQRRVDASTVVKATVEKTTLHAPSATSLAKTSNHGSRASSLGMERSLEQSDGSLAWATCHRFPEGPQTLSRLSSS